MADSQVASASASEVIDEAIEPIKVQKKSRKEKKGKQKGRQKSDSGQDDEQDNTPQFDVVKLIRQKAGSVDDRFKTVCEAYQLSIIQENVDVDVSKLKLYSGVRSVDAADVGKLVDALKSDKAGTLTEFGRSKMFASEDEEGCFLMNDGNHRVAAIQDYNAGVEDGMKIQKLAMGYVLKETPGPIEISYLTMILEEDARKHKTSMKKRDLAKNARLLLANLSGRNDLDEKSKDEEGHRRITEVYQPEYHVLSCIRKFALVSDHDFEYIYDNWSRFNEGSKFWIPVLNNYPFKPKAVMDVLQSFDKCTSTNDDVNKAIQDAPYEIVPMLKSYKAYDENLDEHANLMFFNQTQEGAIEDDFDDFVDRFTTWAQKARTFGNLGRSKKDSTAVRRKTLKSAFQKWANSDAPEAPKPLKEKITTCKLRPHCALCSIKLYNPIAEFRKAKNEAGAALFVYAVAYSGDFSCPTLKGINYEFFSKYVNEDASFKVETLQPTLPPPVSPNISVNSEDGTFSFLSTHGDDVPEIQLGETPGLEKRIPGKDEGESEEKHQQERESEADEVNGSENPETSASGDKDVNDNRDSENTLSTKKIQQLNGSNDGDENVSANDDLFDVRTSRQDMMEFDEMLNFAGIGDEGSNSRKRKGAENDENSYPPPKSPCFDF